MYIGLPVGGDACKLYFWYPLVEHVKNWLSCWKSRNLSIGGGLVLLKSVMPSIEIYFLSFFKAPSGIISILESIFNVFLCVCVCVCVDLLYVVLQVDEEDRWSWRFDSSSRYTMSNVYQLLTQALDHDVVDNGYSNYHHIIWIKEVPLKVSLFALLEQNVLNTTS